MIAGFAGQPAQSAALCAQDEGDPAVERRVPKALFGIAVEPDAPEATRLNLVQGAGQIRDADERQNIQGAARRLGERAGGGWGAAVLNDYAEGAERRCAAQDGADIVGR